MAETKKRGAWLTVQPPKRKKEKRKKGEPIATIIPQENIRSAGILFQLEDTSDNEGLHETLERGSIICIPDSNGECYFKVIGKSAAHLTLNVEPWLDEEEDDG